MPKTPEAERKALYKDIVSAAEEHGLQSEPDMEVGDLQDAVHELIKHVPINKLNDVRASLEDHLEWGS